MDRDQLLRLQASARVYQARADDALSSWGLRAPQMAIGSDIDDCRRGLCVLAKK
jgi:hypothetical protein